MKPSLVLLSCIALACIGTPSQAQLLKKLKDKVNKTLGNESNADQSQDNNNASGKEKEDNNTAKWCDTISTEAVGKDGVQYTLAYSRPGKIDLLYDESSLGLQNNPKGYRMILTERVNNKQQYIVVENGKVIYTDPKIDDKYILKKSSKDQINDGTSTADAAMQKYIVGDTMKQNIPKTDAKSVTIQKVDDDQFAMTMEIAKQTDDYKNMSDAEKKEFEETMRKGMAANNSMAGKTFDIAGQPGANLAMVTGYYVVVKGKKYGKFQMPPLVDVSKDESRFFAVGVDENVSPILIINGKKTALDKNKYMGMSGQIIHSPDQKKFVYIEQMKLSDKQVAEISSGNAGNFKQLYNVIRSDGSSFTVTDYNSSGKFKLSNSGTLVTMNEKTGEVYSDGKPAGKFSMQDKDLLDTDAILLGKDMSQVVYYNGSEGSITYLDGTVRKMNIMFPQTVTDGGATYLSWFRKCGNKIYIARYAY